jgi:hypothetical protein
LGQALLTFVLVELVEAPLYDLDVLDFVGVHDIFVEGIKFEPFYAVKVLLGIMPGVARESEQCTF